MASVQFAPWSSDIESSFFSALNSRKVNHDKLSDAARKLLGRYEIRPSDPPERSARMQIHGNAFTADETPGGFYRAEGMIKNVNTIEEFKVLDRTAIIERAGRVIWESIVDGSIYSCPSLLSSFHTIFFADLKKYRYTYHFAFPALHSDPPWKFATDSEVDAAKHFTPEESFHLFDAVQTWRYSVDPRQHGFFLAKRVSRKDFDALTAGDEDFSEQTAEQREDRPTTPHTPRATDLDFQWVVGSLQAFETGFFNGIAAKDQFVCFADPSTYEKNPGWMLRNLLILIRQRWQLTNVQIVCYRDTHAKREQAKSIIMRLKNESPIEPFKTMPKVVGWERDKNNVLKSRVIDISANMDPTRIADQSAELNLKLIKWRIAPQLDLDTVKNTKCLLLGAGTLGSYVSRNLLGWGVKKITFVDNAKVSFSNPVRQPLYFFKDCLNGGAKKAIRAAEALKEIYPNVDAQGHAISVPMAGHPITDEQAVKADFDTLKRLIDEHDAIFLLMDTRESRWLPSVMGNASGKIVLNAALGFDSYVVMRHGTREASNGPDSLGCYFCNDVVAPADSIKDQTLDQQCTVTRPGIAAIASALLVELLVSVLQHPSRGNAPAPASRASARDPPEHPLGLIPHQIRGYLSNFDNMLIRGPAYDCCSACSDKIVDAYLTDGWEFVRRAVNEQGYVEELSGLKEVQRRAEEAAKALDISDDEFGEGDNDGDGEGELV